MRGTWLQLMCCVPSQLHCPKFQSDGENRGNLEITGEDGGRLRFVKRGVLSRYTDSIIHDAFV